MVARRDSGRRGPTGRWSNSSNLSTKMDGAAHGEVVLCGAECGVWGRTDGQMIGQRADGERGQSFRLDDKMNEKEVQGTATRRPMANGVRPGMAAALAEGRRGDRLRIERARN